MALKLIKFGQKWLTVFRIGWNLNNSTYWLFALDINFVWSKNQLIIVSNNSAAWPEKQEAKRDSKESRLGV